MYGLKQAPRAWYSRIDSSLLSIGFQKSEADPNFYFIMVGDDPLILLLYMDDLFIIGGERLIAVCKRDLASEYEMTDIGLCCCLSHTWGGTWQKSSSHSVCPWRQVSSQGCHLVFDSSV